MTGLWKFIGDMLNSINLPVTLAASFIGAFLGVVTAYLTVRSYFISLIDQRINSDDYLKRVADNLRPSVIFDQEERILSDNGAMKYIEELKVIGQVQKLSMGEVKRASDIIISSKEYLKNIPILESLDETYEVISERGRKFEIRYKLREGGYVMSEASRYRFRLEIIR
jgi:hypothetical protein